jgi:putative addiction module component (TIGR02574 family)
MVAIDKELIEKALELKPHEKLYLIETIIESLDKADKSIDEIWFKEAQERLSAHRAGITTGIPVEEVLGEEL